MTFLAFIIFVVLLCIFAAAKDSGNGKSSHNPYDNYPYPTNNPTASKRRPSTRTSGEPFEEADSYYDRHGNEHLVDDYGYCEDCDDYHDF